MIVAGSLLAGLAAALALVAGPFADGQEYETTAAVLLGFASGWALLALGSARFGDRPQRWAVVPAAAMAASAAGLIVSKPNADALESLGWIWPPLLLALVVWMTVQTHRQPRSWTRPLLLYPVFAVLSLAAAGCGWETLSPSA